MRVPALMLLMATAPARVATAQTAAAFRPGEVDALVLRPSFRSRGVFGEGGRAELWVADDSTRRILPMKSRLSFGSLNLFLTAYQPGR